MGGGRGLETCLVFLFFVFYAWVKKQKENDRTKDIRLQKPELASYVLEKSPAYQIYSTLENLDEPF